MFYLWYFWSGPSNVFKIVKMIMERNFQPVIIFSFSKKECEAYALQVAKLDFNTGINVIIIINNAAKTIIVAYAPARAKLSLGRA